MAFLILLLMKVAIAADLGQFPSLQIDPNTGAIVLAYGSASGLKISICAPEQCSEPRTLQLGCTPPLASAALTLIDGAPFVAYAVMQPSSTAILLALACVDPFCSAYSINKIGPGSNQGFAAAAVLAPSSSNPVITYLDRSRGVIAVATCGNPTCQATTIADLYSVSGVVYHTYGTTDIGFAHNRNRTAVVTFQQWSPNGTEGLLQLGVCPSGACDAANVYVIDSNAAEYTSLALAPDDGDHVLVAYTDATYKQLRIADCKTSGSHPCTIAAVVTTTQTITSPAIRSRADGPVLVAYFQSESGDGGGGALFLLRCRSTRCRDEDPTDAVIIDSSPLWVTSQMQITMQLRPSDGLPVLAYSVFEAPRSFRLKVAVCLTESCQLNRVYTIGDFNGPASIEAKFDLNVFVKGEVAILLVTAVVMGVAIWVRNKFRLLMVYTVGPFTRDVVVSVTCRHVIGMALLSTVCGAILSSVPWLLYAGWAATWSTRCMCALTLVPVLCSAIAYVVVRRCCTFRKLALAAALLVLSLLLVLNLLLTYTIGSIALDCNVASVPLPRDLSLIGIVVMGCSHLVDLFVGVRIYMALSLATPSLLHSRWDEDL